VLLLRSATYMPLLLDTTMTDYTIIFDGGSHGNPGLGYGSYALIRNQDGRVRKKRLRFGDQVTSNQAEYQALIAALEDLIDTIAKAGRSPTYFSVEIKGDSQLVMRQIEGTWKTKSLNLMPLRDKVEELLAQMGSFKLTWQARDKSEKMLGH
jgi:ribonuclease HI